MISLKSQNLTFSLKKVILCVYFCLISHFNVLLSQVSYGSVTAYSLRKTIPTYTGNAIQVRRTCDNATKDIGFTSCGDLDTIALKKFVAASNPLSVITSSAAAAYSLRKLTCSYAGNAINVRRACDDATKDIGFTTAGDLDTAALKSFVMASNPLSAITTSAAAAFSLRKLRCAYAGSVITVRRSSDNTTKDIGFTTAGDLDTTTLKTFVGAGNGFISKWFDQSGNGNHAVQSTTTNQPQLVVAGKVNRQNGQPAIIFSTALTSYLVMPYAAGSLNFSSASTTNVVFAKTGVPSGDASIFDQTYTSGNISVALSWNDGTGASTPLSIGHFPSSSWSFVALSTDVVTNVSNIITGTMLSGAANTTTMNLYQNGTVAATASNKLTIGTNSGLAFNIGKRWDLSDYAPMNLQELIVFASVLPSVDRQYLEWGQSQYYSISGPVLSTLPTGAPGAYVTKWYDQSGNTRDAAQATAANQPPIMRSGIIEKQNGMPAIYFAGTTNSLFTANFSAFSTAACFNGVAKVNSDVTYNAIVNKTNNNNFPCPIDFYNNSLLVGNGISGQYTIFSASQTFNSTMPLGIWTSQANGTTANGVNMYYNGANIVSNQTATYYNDAAGAGLYLGSRFDGVTGLNGWLSEVVTFGSIPSTTDRAFLEWTQGQYYNISGINLGTLPSGAASAFVTIWYDQSGNGNHITQSTTSRQPKIITTGIITKLGTRPAVQGTNGLQTNLTLTMSTSYTGSQLSANTVIQSDIGSTANLRIMSVGTSALTSADYNNSNYFNINQRNTNQFVIERNSVIAPSSVFTVASPMILSARFSGANRQLFNNGTGSTTSADATSFNFNALRILQSINPSFEAGEALTGKMTEFGMYYSSLSTTRRTLIETNQSAYYSLAISNNKYTPPTSASYILHVNGVGRESSTDSVAGTRSTVGMGISVTTAATGFLKDDGDYITFGINCPVSSGVSTSNLSGTVTQRWENDWYVNKTDVSSNGGVLSVFFDFSDYGVNMLPGVASNYVLLYRSSSAGTFSTVPGTTVTVSGDRVLFAVNGTTLTTNYFYTIGTTNPITSPLPIELLNFYCQLINSGTIELKWSTATEANSSYFSVERSSDAVNFTSIGKLAAAGNSLNTRNYSLTDESALTDISYYRLKSVDLDGSYKYSPLCSVTNQNGDNAGDLRIYPNPTSSSVIVDFNQSVYSQPDSYSLMDITGKKIEITSIRDNNIITLDLSSLQPGMYLLEVIKGNKKSVKKITLQK